jgi:hypothetical protein
MLAKNGAIALVIQQISLRGCLAKNQPKTIKSSLSAFQLRDGLSKHATSISRATNLIFFSCKELCNIFKKRKLRLNLAPDGVDVVIVVGSFLSPQSLFQIIEEIREMIGFLVEPQVQLNEWNS